MRVQTTREYHLSDEDLNLIRDNIQVCILPHLNRLTQDEVKAFNVLNARESILSENMRSHIILILIKLKIFLEGNIAKCEENAPTIPEDALSGLTSMSRHYLLMLIDNYKMQMDKLEELRLMLLMESNP